VVGHLRPPADVGVYQALSQCAMHVPIVLGAVGAGLAPAIAVEHHRSDVGAMANAFDATTRWALVICLPWSAVLIVAPDVVLAVLFGARYAGPEAAAALRLIAAGQLVNAATGVPGVLLAMTGRAGSWAIATGVALLAAVAGSALLVPRFGILGAAAATSASTAALNALGVVLARRVLGRWPYDRRTVLVVLSGAASAAGVLGVRALPLRPPAALAACVVVALAVVFGALAAAGFDADARELVRSLRRRRGAA
jgi:O-antigen/teichoic acid export membrane protein